MVSIILIGRGFIEQSLSPAGRSRGATRFPRAEESLSSIRLVEAERSGAGEERRGRRPPTSADGPIPSPR
jgi:hypothetical protein